MAKYYLDLEGLKALIQKITAADAALGTRIDNLDAEATGEGDVIVSVSQANGLVSAAKDYLANVALGAVDNTASDEAITAADTLKVALKKLENKIAAINAAALQADGITIVKGNNNVLSTALDLVYHAAAGNKGAYIALQDKAGNAVGEVAVSDIIGNGVLKSSSYSSATGILTLTFATAAGTDTTVDVNLKQMLDIDDVVIASTAQDYLNATNAGSTADENQVQIGVKLAAVTYTAASGNDPANLSVSTTNGKLLDSDAIAPIKSYVDAVVDAKNVSASGDGTYIAASAADNAVTVAGTYGTLSVTDTAVSSTNGLAKAENVATAVNSVVGALDSSVAATGEANNQYSVLTGVTQTDGKLSAKTEVTLAAVAKTGAAADVAYNNTTSGLTATNTKAAIDEVSAKVDNIQDIVTSWIGNAFDAAAANPTSPTWPAYPPANP